MMKVMMMIFLVIMLRNSRPVDLKPDFNVILHFHDGEEALVTVEGKNEEGEDYSGMADINYHGSSSSRIRRINVQVFSKKPAICIVCSTLYQNQLKTAGLVMKAIFLMLFQSIAGNK